MDGKKYLILLLFFFSCTVENKPIVFDKLEINKVIDKYVENEAKFGRKPNDPFTGKPFTNSSYPIFDGKLKSRIDEYVLNKNGISFSSLKNKRKCRFSIQNRRRNPYLVHFPSPAPPTPRKRSQARKH